MSPNILDFSNFGWIIEKVIRKIWLENFFSLVIGFFIPPNSGPSLRLWKLGWEGKLLRRNKVVLEIYQSSVWKRRRSRGLGLSVEMSSHIGEPGASWFVGQVGVCAIKLQCVAGKQSKRKFMNEQA